MSVSLQNPTRNWEFSKAERNRFKNAFNAAGPDKNAELSWAQAIAAMESADISVAQLHIMLLRNYFAQNSTDRVSFKLFLAMLRVLKQLYKLGIAKFEKYHVNMIVGAFLAMDKNNTGVLEYSQVEDIFINIDPDFDQPSFHKLFIDLTDGKQKKIDLAEYLLLFRRLYTRGQIPNLMIGRRLDAYPAYEDMRFRHNDISKAEYQTFLVLFRLLDKDFDRLISQDETETGLNLIGVEMHRHHFFMGWHILDTDDDARITFPQYCDLLRLAKQIHAVGNENHDYTTSMLMIFKIADKNSTGLLQLSDAARLFAAVDPNIPNSTVSYLFKQIDYTNLGYIDGAEFLAMSRLIYTVDLDEKGPVEVVRRDMNTAQITWLSEMDFSDESNAYPRKLHSTLLPDQPLLPRSDTLIQNDSNHLATAFTSILFPLALILCRLRRRR